MLLGLEYSVTESKDCFGEYQRWFSLYCWQFYIQLSGHPSNEEVSFGTLAMEVCQNWSISTIFSMCHCPLSLAHVQQE
jgi:hypothetical protein